MESMTDQSLLWQDLPTVERNIKITIDSIENVVKRESANLSFTVEHCANILGESGFVCIEPNFNEPPPVHQINYTVNYSISDDYIDSLVSTPILTGEAKTKTKTKTKFTTKSMSLSLSPSSTELIGICNVDLIPILLGEKCLTEKLVVETTQFAFDGTSPSWQNLPLLTVTIVRNGTTFFPDEQVNFLNVTLESVYNLPGSFTESFEYRAGTIAYLENELPEYIFFENGKWKKYRDIERTKRWNTLREIEGRAQLSKYKLDCDFMGLNNPYRKEFDFAKKVTQDVPRVEWNSISRSILRNAGAENMQKHIARYKYWPFEFMLIETAVTKSKVDRILKSQLYQCYVDLSELLFPGNSSTRVVAELRTYNPSDALEKVGLDRNIFHFEPDGRELKDIKEKRSKTQTEVKGEGSDSKSVPLISETGQTTVVVIEIELYKPLIASRITEDFSSLIDKIVAEEARRYPYSGKVAEQHYANSIQKLAETISDSYRDFHAERAKETGSLELDDRFEKNQLNYKPNSERDELSCFTQYLYKTGVYLSVRATLKAKVTMILDQKFTNQSNVEETENLIASAYTYLIEEMHTAINRVVEGRHAEDLTKAVNAEKLYFYAEEAYELGRVNDASRYYTTIIAANQNDPDSWANYGIFLLKMGDKDRARECCLEAISFNRRHLIALLVYAAILFGNREYREAEIFLIAITEFYPRFVEGWIVLHLFYIRTEYYPGIELTVRTAEKCMTDRVKNQEPEEEPLAWSTIYATRQKNSSVYARTGMFLLKYHLCEFAEIALAQEISNAGRSTYVLYYMAVHHYLSGRYEDALSHLREAQCDYGMDYSISSLTGHCHSRLGNFDEAIDLYEFAHMLFDRPDNLHLLSLRMGFHYLRTEKYEQAKNVFLTACNGSPTSQTWLGAGMSLYHLNEFTEAEAALSEANKIDNRNADVWGYLCLVNISLERYDEFLQTYRQVVQNNLENRKLWLMITQSMQALNYAPSTLTPGSVDR